MVQITENASKQILKMLDEAAAARRRPSRRPAGGRVLRVRVRVRLGAGPAARRQRVRPDPTRRGSSSNPRSFRLLDNAVLDYDTNLVSKGFFFQNPNAKSTCGCGTSFSA